MRAELVRVTEVFPLSTAMGGFQVPVTGGESEPLNTGQPRFIATMTTASRPTERNWAISDSTQDGKSRIYVLPNCGVVRRV